MAKTAAKTVRWKPGAVGLHGYDPDTILGVLSDLPVLTPAEVVAAAKLKRHPLHDCFEWDNEAAGQKEREQQAAHIIRSIEIVDEGDEEGASAIRAFTHVVEIRDEEETPLYAAGIYRGTEEVMHDEEYRKQILRRAFADLEAWERRYHQFKELAAIIGAAGEARKLFEFAE